MRENAFITLFCMVSILLSPDMNPVTLFIRPLLMGTPGPRERDDPRESEGEGGEGRVEEGYSLHSIQALKTSCI